ncbi:MAG: hypothetical protein WCI89_00935 [bacterium]
MQIIITQETGVKMTEQEMITIAIKAIVKNFPKFRGDEDSKYLARFVVNLLPTDRRIARQSLRDIVAEAKKELSWADPGSVYLSWVQGALTSAQARLVDVLKFGSVEAAETARAASAPCGARTYARPGTVREELEGFPIHGKYLGWYV